MCSFFLFTHLLFYVLVYSCDPDMMKIYLLPHNYHTIVKKYIFFKITKNWNGKKEKSVFALYHHKHIIYCPIAWLCCIRSELLEESEQIIQNQRENLVPLWCHQSIITLNLFYFRLVLLNFKKNGESTVTLRAQHRRVVAMVCDSLRDGRNTCIWTLRPAVLLCMQYQ